MIQDKLQTIFQDIFDDETIQLHHQMTADDIEEWDSLTHIQLIVAIEKAFQVKLNTTDIIATKNVADFIALLEKETQ